jgi:hypothetical protein
VVLADACPAAFLALASYAVVIEDACPAAFLALASYAVVLADACPPALFTPASYAVVWALCAPLLDSASSCPRTVQSLPTLCLPCRVRSLGQRTISLLHSLPFPRALNPFLLVLGLFLSLVFELLASRPTVASLTVRPPFCLLAPPSIACVANKTHYQAFFWVLIDLIVELLVLIIKPFDNQTEI